MVKPAEATSATGGSTSTGGSGSSFVQVFEIDTKGTCLLCLDDIRTSSNPTPTTKDANALKMLLRYLKIDVMKLGHFSSSFLPFMSDMENVQLCVNLCDQCSSVTTEFLQLFQDYEMMRIQMDMCAQTLHELIRKGENDDGRFERYRRRIGIRNPADLLNASIAEGLRRETLKKCENRLNATVPRVSAVQLNIKEVTVSKHSQLNRTSLTKSSSVEKANGNGEADNPENGGLDSEPYSSLNMQSPVVAVAGEIDLVDGEETNTVKKRRPGRPFKNKVVADNENDLKITGIMTLQETPSSKPGPLSRKRKGGPGPSRLSTKNETEEDSKEASSEELIPQDSPSEKPVEEAQIISKSKPGPKSKKIAPAPPKKNEEAASILRLLSKKSAPASGTSSARDTISQDEDGKADKPLNKPGPLSRKSETGPDTDRQMKLKEATIILSRIDDPKRDKASRTTSSLPQASTPEVETPAGKPARKPGPLSKKAGPARARKIEEAGPALPTSIEAEISEPKSDSSPTPAQNKKPGPLSRKGRLPRTSESLAKRSSTEESNLPILTNKDKSPFVEPEDPEDQTNTGIIIPPEVSTSTPTGKPVTCRLCKTEFASRGMLIQHQHREHRNRNKQKTKQKRAKVKEEDTDYDPEIEIPTSKRSKRNSRLEDVSISKEETLAEESDSQSQSKEEEVEASVDDDDNDNVSSDDSLFEPVVAAKKRKKSHNGQKKQVGDFERQQSSISPSKSGSDIAAGGSESAGSVVEKRRGRSSTKAKINSDTETEKVASEIEFKVDTKPNSVRTLKEAPPPPPWIHGTSVTSGRGPSTSVTSGRGPSTSVTSGPSTSSSSIKCDLCPEVFQSPLALYDHTVLNHNGGTDRLHFKCSLCNTKQDDAQSLLSHLQNVHEDTSNKTIFCPFCSDSFTTHHLATLHRRFQHWKQPFLICDDDNCTHPVTSFSSVGEVNAHMMDDHPYKETFHCETCNRAFFSSYRKSLHENLHVPMTEGYFYCPHCFWKYTRKNILLDHVNNVHNGGEGGGTLPQCSNCSSFVMTEKELEAHERNCGGGRGGGISPEKAKSPTVTPPEASPKSQKMPVVGQAQIDARNQRRQLLQQCVEKDFGLD